MTDKAILERIAGALERIADAQEKNLAAAQLADEQEAGERERAQASKEKFNSLMERAFNAAEKLLHGPAGFTVPPQPSGEFQQCSYVEPETGRRCGRMENHPPPHMLYPTYPTFKPQ